MIAVWGALLIGLTLGLLGSGGSILTVPVLVYLLGHQDKVAIAESLAIVGAIALSGMIPYAGARQVDWRSVVFFGLPGMAGTYGGAWLARYVPGTAQLVLFGGVMLLAAWLMFRKATKSAVQAPVAATGGEEESQPPGRHPLWKIIAEGVVVGLLTGLVGVGGGFLIVPALVILGGLPMRIAVGTSLAIIFLNSLVGFSKYLGVLEAADLHIDVRTVVLFIAIGVVGSQAGRLLSNWLDQAMLRKVFAVFLVVMGLFVLGKEAPRLFAGPLAAAPAERETSKDVHKP